MQQACLVKLYAEGQRNITNCLVYDITFWGPFKWRSKNRFPFREITNPRGLLVRNKYENDHRLHWRIRSLSVCEIGNALKSLEDCTARTHASKHAAPSTQPTYISLQGGWAKRNETENDGDDRLQEAMLSDFLVIILRCVFINKKLRVLSKRIQRFCNSHLVGCFFFGFGVCVGPGKPFLERGNGTLMIFTLQFLFCRPRRRCCWCLIFFLLLPCLPLEESSFFGAPEASNDDSDLFFVAAVVPAVHIFYPLVMQFMNCLLSWGFWTRRNVGRNWQWMDSSSVPCCYLIHLQPWAREVDDNELMSGWR